MESPTLYWAKYSWQYVRNEVLPELRYRVSRLRWKNDTHVKEEKRIADMLARNPLHGSIKFTPNTDYEFEKDRYEHDQMVRCEEYSLTHD